MTTEQKDQQVTDNQSDQQKQGNQVKQESPTKSDNPSSKPTTSIEEEDEKTGTTKKEFPGKERPHDSKTPVTEQTQQE